MTLSVEALLEGEHEALTRVAVEKALSGDIGALGLCLDRIAPPRKDAPIRFNLSAVRSAADAVKASTDVIAAVADGVLTPAEAARIMALLTQHRLLIETADLEERVSDLELRFG